MLVLRTEYVLRSIWICILNQILPLHDIEAVSNPTQIHTPAIATDFATDATCAELVGHGGLGIEAELDAAALAATIEFPVVIGC